MLFLLCCFGHYSMTLIMTPAAEMCPYMLGNRKLFIPSSGSNVFYSPSITYWKIVFTPFISNVSRLYLCVCMCCSFTLINGVCVSVCVRPTSPVNAACCRRWSGLSLWSRSRHHFELIKLAEVKRRPAADTGLRLLGKTQSITVAALIIMSLAAVHWSDPLTSDRRTGTQVGATLTYEWQSVNVEPFNVINRLIIISTTL